MACGDRYASEIVTVDGYTIDNPYGVVAFPGDAQGWRQLAERILDRMLVRWRQLGESEPSPYEFWNAHVEEKNALEAAVADLPSFNLTGSGITETIDASRELILKINCLREKIDDRLGELRVPLTPLPGSGAPKPAPGLAAGFGTVVVLGVVGLVAYYVFSQGIKGD